MNPIELRKKTMSVEQPDMNDFDYKYKLGKN